jgi:hypothetical protein
MMEENLGHGDIPLFHRDDESMDLVWKDYPVVVNQEGVLRIRGMDCSIPA